MLITIVLRMFLLIASFAGAATSSIANDTEAVVGAGAFIIDDDSAHWDADIGLVNGGVIPAAAAQLFRVYYGALGRLPDNGGFIWWFGEIAQERHNLRTMAAGFVFSEEFQGIADGNGDGSVSDAEFIDHMYRNVFGREPDAEGFAWWTAELSSARKSQTDVLVEMTQSNEYVGLTLEPLAGYLPEGGATPSASGPGLPERAQYWEMVVTKVDGERIDVTGASVALASPTVIVLGDSTPAGWSVSFTITGELPIGIPYTTDNGDLLNAAVGTPTGADCVATPSTNFALPSFVTLGPAEGGVPQGIGTVFVEGGCGDFSAETSFQLGFGVQ